MGVTTAGWALTIGVIVALLAVDLLLATVRPHAVGYREATAWSAFYIAVAVIFGLVFEMHPLQQRLRALHQIHCLMA